MYKAHKDIWESASKLANKFFISVAVRRKDKMNCRWL